MHIILMDCFYTIFSLQLLFLLFSYISLNKICGHNKIRLKKKPKTQQIQNKDRRFFIKFTVFILLKI
jgi:hypothetical protein